MMIVCRFLAPALRTWKLAHSFAFNKPYNKNRIKPFEKRESGVR
jgi:hypothetical protein